MHLWVVVLRLTGLGWYVAFCILIGVVGGWRLDVWLGTKGIFLLLGTVLGSVVAFWGLYKMVQPLMYGAQSRSTPGDRSEQ